MNTSLIVGIDGEMSSAELQQGGKLIQIGGAARLPDGTLDLFSSLIRHDSMQWSERAFQVHGITRETLAEAPCATAVDLQFRDWLISVGAPPGARQVIAAGYNVVAFDRPFISDALPQSAALISRRGIDLNALCFTLEGWTEFDGAEPRPWTGWKRAATKAAARTLADAGIEPKPHDAGWDAAMHLLAFEWLRDQIHAARRPVAARQDVPDSLRNRLDSLIGTAETDALLDLIEAAGHSARLWLGRNSTTLGCPPIVALDQGRLPEVQAALQP